MYATRTLALVLLNTKYCRSQQRLFYCCLVDFIESLFAFKKPNFKRNPNKKHFMKKYLMSISDFATLKHNNCMVYLYIHVGVYTLSRKAKSQVK